MNKEIPENHYYHSSYKTAHEATVRMDFVNEQFVMLNDHPFVLIDGTDDPDRETYVQPYYLCAHEHIKSYTLTWDKIRSAMSDYWKGYKAGQEASKS